VKLTNPILQRELKERIRSRKVVVGFTVYLSVLAFILYTSERAVERNVGGAFASAATGRTVFQVLVMGLLILISFLVPSYAAGSISNERERQTFALVQVTLMSPLGIVLGKLGATMSWLMFLLIASLPFFAIGFVLGGVTIWDMLLATAGVMFIGVVLASVGLALSSRVRRTSNAVITAQLLILGLLAGTAMLYGVMRSADLTSGTRSNPTWVLAANPVMGMAAAIGEPGRAGSGPFDSLAQTLQEHYSVVTNINPGTPVPPGSRFNRTYLQGTGPFLAGFGALYAVVALFSLRVAVAGVRAPRHKVIVGTPRRRRAAKQGA
jgi:ABC-type transport system involved in multi-copper enzyme maturation permease subunit